jgi:hypothetical protein
MNCRSERRSPTVVGLVPDCSPDNVPVSITGHLAPLRPHWDRGQSLARVFLSASVGTGCQSERAGTARGPRELPAVWFRNGIRRESTVRQWRVATRPVARLNAPHGLRRRAKGSSARDLSLEAHAKIVNVYVLQTQPGRRSFQGYSNKFDSGAQGWDLREFGKELLSSLRGSAVRWVEIPRPRSGPLPWNRFTRAFIRAPKKHIADRLRFFPSRPFQACWNCQQDWALGQNDNACGDDRLIGTAFLLWVTYQARRLIGVTLLQVGAIYC